jgi:hypothetical protein
MLCAGRRELGARYPQNHGLRARGAVLDVLVVRGGNDGCGGSGLHGGDIGQLLVGWM